MSLPESEWDDWVGHLLLGTGMCLEELIHRDNELALRDGCTCGQADCPGRPRYLALNTFLKSPDSAEVARSEPS